MVKDSWLQELNRHPFFSSKARLLIPIGKPGKAIYLMKERAKLVRTKKRHTRHEVSQRLG